jgi:hypothetical protein
MTRASFIGPGSQGAGVARRIIEQGVPTTFLELLGYPRNVVEGVAQ